MKAPSRYKTLDADEDHDVLVIGAGAAGLSCARRLHDNGLKVLILEARDRIGGRMHSVAAESYPPIELGAEFIHGAEPTYLDKFLKCDAGFSDVCDSHFILKGRHLQRRQQDFWAEIEDCEKHLDAHRKPDRSIAEYLEENGPLLKKESCDQFRAFIEGFYGADLHLIGERGLANSEENPTTLNGRDQFRPLSGYSVFAKTLFPQVTEGNQALIRLNTEVQEIFWQPGRVQIHALERQQPVRFSSRCVVVTVPVGLLKTKMLTFDPEPPGLQKALDGLHMGHVQRITFQFRTRFWETLANEPIGFLHASSQEYFPTWWTQMPLRTTRLVAWQGGPRAQEMSGWSEDKRVFTALKTLAKITGLPHDFLAGQMLDWHTHDWSGDRFSLGAYSYPGLDGEDRARRLLQPYDDTIYFAGEAMAFGVSRGTVHGAIESGEASAEQILNSLRTRAPDVFAHLAARPLDRSSPSISKT